MLVGRTSSDWIITLSLGRLGFAISACAGHDCSSLMTPLSLDLTGAPKVEVKPETDPSERQQAKHTRD